ncbi:MAG: RHS repeat-associated core domain-containing protein [Mycobacteriaceae bacterium]|nr:RHS repeat-associated core domain-containing protein [Mycobacteriaceae bacterium]
MTDSGATITYWQVNTMTASGRILTETLGNGLTTTKTYDALDRPTLNKVSNGGTDHQHFTHQYDTLGNMTQRVDVVQSSLTEAFSYDRLNRLLQSSGSGLTTHSYTYNAIGNITSQSGRGTYRYDASGSCTPGSGGGAYAVKCIEGTVNGFTNPAFSYDANGNMTSGLGRTLTYTSYNMPAQVVGVGYSGGTSTTYDYVYNAEHERTKLVHSTLGSFIYLHPAGKGQLLYEKQTEASPSTRIEHKYYISAGGIAVAVHYARENPNVTETTTATRYLHQDHLGSITLITNEAGGVTERLAYEAYGKRRYPAGTDDPTNGLFGQVTDRGFTSHEHLDEIALIHMNGRIYDPVLGRFITADPFLQNPGDLQSYNRYSYVLNNPLMYVDPSGYF